MCFCCNISILCVLFVCTTCTIAYFWLGRALFLLKKQVFGLPTAKSQPIWIKFCIYLLLCFCCTCTNPCTAWRLSIWRSCAGPSLTSRGAVTSALQRVHGLLLTPRYYLSTYGRRAFSYAGPSAWNSLPEHLRAPDLTLNSFRHSLKTFLFTQMTHPAH